MNPIDHPAIKAALSALAPRLRHVSLPADWIGMVLIEYLGPALRQLVADERAACANLADEYDSSCAIGDAIRARGAP